MWCQDTSIFHSGLDGDVDSRHIGPALPSIHIFMETYVECSMPKSSKERYLSCEAVHMGPKTYGMNSGEKTLRSSVPPSMNQRRGRQHSCSTGCPITMFTEYFFLKCTHYVCSSNFGHTVRTCSNRKIQIEAPQKVKL